MQYRPEVDGLRAVAVIPVVFFHSGISTFAGGFVGVDVFFVISGYLITSIIFEDIAKGRFSIVRFYERRARRILPPLVFICALTIPFAWLWMLPAEFKSYANSLISVNLFSSNILFWQESGYFEPSVDSKPLLHTWSLAVEEQFYIFFPLLLLAVRRLPRQAIVALVGLIFVGSLAAAQWASGAKPDANFYLLPTRAWELSVGALIALSMREFISRPANGVGWGGLVGVAMILYSVVVFDESVPFPGVYALIPVMGTALTIVFATDGTLAARALAWRPLVFVGLLSYSIYLWHQPLFAFARIRLYRGVAPVTYLVLGIISVGLAYLSWKFVEGPFRNRSFLNRGQVFRTAALGSGVLLAAGLAISLTGGFPDRFDSETLAIALVAEEGRDDNRSRCVVGTLERGFSPDKVCRSGDHSSEVFLWGDSHALALVPELASMFEPNEISLAQLTAEGCTPTIGYEWENKPYSCTNKMTDMRSHLLELSEPGDIIVVHGRWTNLFSPFTFDNGEGGVETDAVTRPIINQAPELTPRSDEWLDHMANLLVGTLDELVAHDRRLVLIYPVPEAGWDVPQMMARAHHFSPDGDADFSTSYDVFRSRSARAYSALDSVGEGHDVIRLYPADLFCGTEVADRCMIAEEGRPLYVDDDHLSRLGASMVAGQLEEALQTADWQS